MAPLALLSGIAIAPLIAAGSQLVGDVAPQGALTEAYTWPLTSLVAGVAAGNAASGVIVGVDRLARGVRRRRRRRRASASPSASLRRATLRPARRDGLSREPQAQRPPAFAQSAQVLGRRRSRRRSGARRGAGRAAPACRRAARRTARSSGSSPSRSSPASIGRRRPVSAADRPTGRRARAGRRRRAARRPARTRGSRRRGGTASPHQLQCSRAIGASVSAACGAAAAGYRGRMPDPVAIVVLEGDQTGQELLDQALRVHRARR